MLRGLYTSWTGMLTENKRLDVISNNIANAATTGYKKEGVTTQSFDDVFTYKIKDMSDTCKGKTERIGTMALGVKIGEVYTDYTQGSVRATENTYDLALQGDGFFQVRVTDANGNDHIRYTRAGNFHITNEGYIVDSEGNHLQSEGGDLMVSTDAGNVVITSDGNVYEDGELTEKISIVDFEDYSYLKKYGETMYEPVDGAKRKEASVGVMQGYLEQSNVNVVTEMVNLINITRAYEANQKSLKAADESLDLAVNSVGRV